MLAPSPRPVQRIALGTLLAFVSLNAVGGGIYGLAGAEGVPLEWLEGSPFTTYRVPSLVLLTVVGGSLAAAAVAVFARARKARLLSRAAGVILLGWIAVQLALIGYVSWLQPAMVVAGVVILALTARWNYADHHPSHHAVFPSR